MKLIYTILLFLLAVIIHELGHYFSYRLTKRKAFFKFHWWGITAECENRFTLTLQQYFFIALNGILWGLVVIRFTGDVIYISAYLLMCCLDFSICFSILGEPFKNWNMTLFQKIEKEYEKSKKELNQKPNL